MKTVSSTEAKARLNALLAEVESTGSPVTITSHGRPVAILTAATPPGRVTGSLEGVLEIPDDFDAPLADADVAFWEGTA